MTSPSWDGLRPTSDKLRETLFNVLAPRMKACAFLDAYAGTGAVGLEAFSRGAAHVTFIDHDPRAVALIADNLRTCAITAGYTIEQAEVRAMLERMPPTRSFDVIVLDPPYGLDGVGAVLDVAARRLALDGVLVLERATRANVDVPPSLRRIRDIRSGDSTLTLLERMEGV